MANALPNTPGGTTPPAEQPEPADSRMYLNLSIAFLVGIAFLMLLFVTMLILLAGAR